MIEVINLDGQWDFVVDQDPKYHSIYPGFHLPKVNRRHWHKVNVPSVWQKYGQRYEIFEGVGWFAREFEINEISEDTISRICFDGINYLCNVYINEEFIGFHEGGYTAFWLDISRKIKKGTNHIAIQVDNRTTNIKWPPCLGYYNYGGIHRSVRIEMFEDSFLEEVKLSSLYDKESWILDVSGCVGKSQEGLSLTVFLESKELGKIEITQGGIFSIKLPLQNVNAWSPENPKLYDIHIYLFNSSEELIQKKKYSFGFRTLGISEGQIFLNSSPIQLNGICYVYDSETYGLVMSKEQISKDLNIIKDMGCNAIRCHYPMDASFYSECDQMGLLVWIEPPIYCYHPADDEVNTKYSDIEWVNLSQQMAKEMINTARNHPSVIMYSIGNECNTLNPEAPKFFSELVKVIKEKDPYRLISYAALYGNVSCLAELVDVLGINSYWGWYDKIWGGKGLAPEDYTVQDRLKGDLEPIDLSQMKQMIEKVLAAKPDLALLLTEFGADSVPGFYSKSRDMWSEDYHADLLIEIFKLAKEYPCIVGTFPFVFSDYRDPSKIHNGYWNEINLKGAVDYHRNHKKAFYAIRKAYKE